MSAKCLRCGAGNEWIEGKPTHSDTAYRELKRHADAMAEDLRWIRANLQYGSDALADYEAWVKAQGAMHEEKR